MASAVEGRRSVGLKLAANSSAQLKERHSDNQSVGNKSRDEFHG